MEDSEEVLIAICEHNKLRIWKDFCRNKSKKAMLSYAGCCDISR